MSILMAGVISVHFTQLVDHCVTMPKKLLGIIGQDHNDSKSGRLHVDIFRFDALFI